MLGKQQTTIQKYYEAVAKRGLWEDRASLERYLAFLFRDISFEGKSILDIGGGTGLFSFYAAARGAERVVCLEPQSDGGHSDMNDKFNSIATELALQNVRLIPKTFQQFETAPGSFDIILLHNSVNHLDEWACIHLKNDKVAVDHYMDLFSKLAAQISDGGTIILSDCTRYNFFPLLGLKHPINKTIEWHKHQSPETWAGLLTRVGFVQQSISWSSFNRMGKLGWLLFANRIGAFFLKGHFCLHMSK